jgi:hypothetical protein
MFPTVLSIGIFAEFVMSIQVDGVVNANVSDAFIAIANANHFTANVSKVTKNEWLKNCDKHNKPYS